MAKVTVTPWYDWECSQCYGENRISWMPEPGQSLPACKCGHKDKCGDIIEESRPPQVKKVRPL